MPVPAPYPAMQVYGTPGVPMQVTPTRGMYTAAAILNWVGFAIFAIATAGIGLIAGAWIVPMTILTHKAAKDPYKHTALAVCTLLFVNVISGVLMLVDDGNRPPKPYAMPPGYVPYQGPPMR